MVKQLILFLALCFVLLPLTSFSQSLESTTTEKTCPPRLNEAYGQLVVQADNSTVTATLELITALTLTGELTAAEREYHMAYVLEQSRQYILIKKTNALADIEAIKNAQTYSDAIKTFTRINQSLEDCYPQDFLETVKTELAVLYDQSLKNRIEVLTSQISKGKTKTDRAMALKFIIEAKQRLASAHEKPQSPFVPCIRANGTLTSGDVFTQKDYAALGPSQIHQKMNDLVNRYPEVLSLVIYGQSTDGKDLYAIRFTDSPALADSVAYGVSHILMESGLHAREIANPYITLKTLELYVKDYYDDQTIPSLHIKQLFNENCLVIHTLPLTNPDGYGLVKTGLSTVQNDTLRNKLRSQYKSFNGWKANLNGVDLNRNFPSHFYNVTTKKWQALWGKANSLYVARSAGPAFYRGPAAASEIETRSLMAYVDQYDFRVALSYHSMGRVIYHDRTYLNMSEFAWLSQDYALMAGQLSAYKVLYTAKSEEKNQSTGYLGDYFSNAHLKPFITLETGLVASIKTAWPAEEEFKRTHLILGETLKKAIAYGNFRYIVVQSNGEYYRDYINKAYAEAVAKKIGGQVIDKKPD